MDIDRQALLEQKRQRLLELRQRRLQKEEEERASKSEEEIVTPEPENNMTLNEDLPKKIERVDFAVQVGQPGQSTTFYNAAKPSLIIRFDKAIQVLFDDDSDEDNGETVEPEIEKVLEPEIPEPSEPLKAEVVNETLLTKLESELHFPFSKLRLGIKEEKDLRPAGDSPFTQIHLLDGFVQRPIVDIQTTSQFPDLVLVAYGPSETRMPDLASPKGLAIIYNVASESPFPEFFLHATSTITSIVFDKTDAFRIVAGMNNGRLVLWDLTNVKPNQLSVTPSLQTSLLASYHGLSQKGIKHHTNRIVKIEQPEVNSASPSVVSVCAKGIINVWSLSILAFPKLPSRIVREDGDSKIHSSVDTNDVLITSAFRFQDDSSYHAPEFRFLNNTYLGCDRGEIFKLKNGKDGTLIDKTLNDEQAKASVLSLAEMVWKQDSTRYNIIVSSHLDWSLRFWHYSSPEPLFEIPTQNLISKILKRPGYDFQFAALNTFSPPKASTSVDFWDLEIRILGPICTVPLEDDFGKALLIAFNSEGNVLIVGSKTGKLAIWKIDGPQLAKVVEQKTNRDIDGGIMHYMSSVTLAI